MRMNLLLQILLPVMFVATATLAQARDSQRFSPLRTVVTKNATFKMIGAHIFSKKTKLGWTYYQYENGVLTKESGPGGVEGRYLYGKNGALEHIVYSNGRTISTRYGSSGDLQELQSSTAWRAKFHRKPSIGIISAAVGQATAPKRSDSIAASLMLQDAIAPMDMVCVEGGPACIIDVWPGDNGSGSGSAWLGGRDIGGGGGGGSGNIGPRKGPNLGNSMTVEECKAAICDAGLRASDDICAKVRSVSGRIQCAKEAFEIYAKCLRSCGDGDWSWIEG